MGGWVGVLIRSCAFGVVCVFCVWMVCMFARLCVCVYAQTYACLHVHVIMRRQVRLDSYKLPDLFRVDTPAFIRRP
ncbi:MAG: hypothetical protein ACPIOQ_71715, partial [Promethearchaeia archaeon]